MFRLCLETLNPNIKIPQPSSEDHSGCCWMLICDACSFCIALKVRWLNVIKEKECFEFGSPFFQTGEGTRDVIWSQQRWVEVVVSDNIPVTTRDPIFIITSEFMCKFYSADCLWPTSYILINQEHCYDWIWHRWLRSHVPEVVPISISDCLIKISNFEMSFGLDPKCTGKKKRIREKMCTRDTTLNQDIGTQVKGLTGPVLRAFLLLLGYYLVRILDTLASSATSLYVVLVLHLIGLAVRTLYGNLRPCLPLV